MKNLTLLSVVALGTIALVGVAKVDGDTKTTYVSSKCNLVVIQMFYQKILGQM